MGKNCIKVALKADFHQRWDVKANPIEVNLTNETGENPIFELIDEEPSIIAEKYKDKSKG